MLLPAPARRRGPGNIVALITRDIRAFVERDWRSVRESKDDYWAARIARLGPAEGLRIAGELRAQVIAMHPEWPAADDREADLASHARVSELMRRADAARRG
jgi:hypothetical protein